MKGIHPAVTSDSGEFWEFAQRGEFRCQRCIQCQRFRWPSSPACFHCLSFDAEWKLMAGTGTLQSWVTYRRQYFTEFPPPYVVGLVELPEGPRYPSLIVGIDPDSVQYGMRLLVAFVDVENELGETILIPMFQADTASPATL
jgi:uncharacterized OB-fold protein